MGIIFHADSTDSSSLYHQELKFGRVMLKRAVREARRLEAQVQQARENGQDAEHLEARLTELQASIMDFEGELNGVESQMT